MMKQSFKKPLILLPSLLLVVTSITYVACKRNSESVGPAYYSAPAGFAPVLDIPVSSVNFKSSTFAPNTNLGTKVTWTLTYKGLTSGAVKTFSGSSDIIDGSNALWNGSHDGLYFFKQGETVEATLSFLGTDYVTKDHITVTKPRDFISNNTNAVAVGIDFSTTPISYNNGYENAAFYPNGIIEYPAQLMLSSGRPHCFDPQPVINLISKAVQGTVMPAVEGNYYYKVQGTSYDTDGYFVGGLQHRQEGFFFPDWKDPENIYFNIYIYGYGKDSTNNTIINLEFHEADLSNNVTKPKNECNVPNSAIGAPSSVCAVIQPDQHDPCTDDGWVYQIPVTHSGWKLFSVKYSDFNVSASATNGGSGNKTKEPDRVYRIQVGVVSSPAKTQAYAMFDYPVITYGAPFDPSK